MSIDDAETLLLHNSQKKALAFGILYKEAIKHNNSYAKYICGLCLLDGWGVPKNTTKAFSLFNEAYEAGNIFAKYELGICYLNGYGVAKDEAKAKKLIY